MKRTDYKVCCGTKAGYAVYRAVITDGERYFVKWNGKHIDVSKDIRLRNYIRKTT